MYDHFVGEIIECQPARVVLRAGGIGYELKVPLSAASRLRPGQTAKLFTILHVVDGTPSLLGFATLDERELARRLLTVSGVGPAMSLAILSSYPPAQVARLIVDGDADALRRVRGVGQKTAERLCLELRDQVAKLDLAGAAPSGPVLLPQSSEDAIAALVTLGFTDKDARKKVEAATRKAPEAGTEDLIKTVLRG